MSLQQYLPFTVLKLMNWLATLFPLVLLLQQYLPFTVLKRKLWPSKLSPLLKVATVLTVYGIETSLRPPCDNSMFLSCNSTYRLRY